MNKYKSGNTNSRAVCVYDTASLANPAHGEIAKSQYVVDEVELRHNLFQVFCQGKPIDPCEYRGGEIWEQLPQDLKR